ncbi:unnamed protein product [Rotaria socialis]|uniref:Uncharacterized protein n=1 Tax=Rotaria socialis TaxID=392032 RepID=A0A821PUH1_9BILA|nr:unnamed protein product [Rotaria socialis]CAF4150841.1 unnamed protein product [Rotaria socialis]CAF4166073.1 unnamed protein product [Rotaria socialis]CAF4305367.1 unnamed protein product [Rotaria socialis]CAF4460261.1 unnamed protein product [Rotaria socialis]
MHSHHAKFNSSRITMKNNELRLASTAALTFSPKRQIRFFEQLNDLKLKFILRPMEISNNPEAIRCMSLITINTA